jgi:hypothetical protein
MWRSRSGAITAALLSAVAATTASTSVAIAEKARFVDALEAGESVFWNGEYTKRGNKTFTYQLPLLEPADFLRIAIDVPTRTDWYRVALFDPAGRRAAKTLKAYAYNAELVAPQPSTGTWTVEVKADYVSQSVFRMRAQLADDDGTPDAQDEALLPDLRAIPAFDVTFSAPDNGGGSDYDNDPDDAYPPGPVSCALDETLEDRVLSCLRFSAGIENAGVGPLDLRFEVNDPQQRMYQVIHRSDGTKQKRRAGRFEYHHAHTHFHYTNIWTFTLLKVTDLDKGKMQSAARARKSGFCPADQRIADWHAFYQAPAYSVRSDCGMHYEELPTGDWIGLPKSGRASMGFSAGWGDVYGWYRPGNYVEFPLGQDGYYVVRATVDGEHNVKESQETNNAAYALIKVTGEQVRVLERGRGTDPWDPNKVVIRDWWRPLVP